MPESTLPRRPDQPAPPAARRGDRTHRLYLAVIAAVVAGVAVGLVAPEVGIALKPLGTAFVGLVTMMVGPIIFCTIALGVGSVARAATVGLVGGLAIGYFLAMSTLALTLGLVVGNLLHPGEGLHMTGVPTAPAPAAHQGGGTVDFLLGVIPDTLFSALTGGQVLQTLLVALLAGFALQQLGEKGAPIVTALGHLQRLVFRILAMIMWAAPVGAFGAIAAVVGATGPAALRGLATLMLGFYLTCVVFVVAVLGPLLWLVARINLFALLRYLGREFLLILATSSSETALPRLIAKMEHLGVGRPVVGIAVPTGYSFNLDGTAIYLTMASLFVASALDAPLSLGEQVSLLVFMVIASKGAAGVTGAGLATLAGGLQSHRPALADGVGLIVGIDRFMSEARALTNFTGNAVATVLLGTWTRQFDRERARAVLSGREPFDESTLLDDDDHGPGPGPGSGSGSSPGPGSTRTAPTPEAGGNATARPLEGAGYGGKP